MKGNLRYKDAERRPMSEMSSFFGAHLTVFSMLKQADVCKHAKWMLNVSGMFFIVSGVS